MSTATPDARPEIEYPDSDGLPMADNTLQWQWIVLIKQGLEALFRERPDVFVAADLFWYPVEGHPEIRTAPDGLVVFGRPKGYRGSYMQWREGGIAPQVVFEVLSPGNRPAEMLAKRLFYERHGVQEYYVYDPDRVTLEAWIRDGGPLRPVSRTDGWTSPLTGIRFDLSSGEEMILWRPDGERFKTYEEVEREKEAERLRAQAERLRAEKADLRADGERQRADSERERAEQLAAQLRRLGIEPEA